MATKSVGPAIVAALVANGAVTALLGSRICAAGGVLEDEDLPYATYEATSNEEETDLEGPSGDCFADLTITITSLDRDEADNCAKTVAAALRDLAGTFAGVTIVDSLVGDVSAEPAGPVDSDDGEVFQSQITLQIEYR